MGMLALVLALICSTAPTNLPVREWATYVHPQGTFMLRYPPCWNIGTTDDPQYGFWLHLHAPDGSAEITIKQSRHRGRKQDLRALLAEHEGHIGNCKIAGKEVPCAIWSERTGEFERAVIYSAQLETSFTSRNLGQWEKEARKILNSFRLTGR